MSMLFTDIFNSLLESRQVPEDWRGENVTPLFKKGTREELGNFRPVSLTSVIGEGVGHINLGKVREPFA